MSAHNEYDDDFIAGLQWMWGTGFLSPGGVDEVSEICRGTDVSGAKVLDIGCGLGGADIHLVSVLDADHVTGIDVEAPLVEKARELVNSLELGNSIDIRLVEPGRLPFPDDSFDLVFSKDSMVHIPDKIGCYSEIQRVLIDGGVLALSDWFGDASPVTKEMEQWLDVVGLSLALGTLGQAVETLIKLGFDPAVGRDRNAWYAEYMTLEIESISGEQFEPLCGVIGAEAAQKRLQSSTLKKTVVEQGQLRPGHIRAVNRK